MRIQNEISKHKHSHTHRARFNSHECERYYSHEDDSKSLCHFQCAAAQILSYKQRQFAHMPK